MFSVFWIMTDDISHFLIHFYPQISLASVSPSAYTFMCARRSRHVGCLIDKSCFLPFIVIPHKETLGVLLVSAIIPTCFEIFLYLLSSKYFFIFVCG